MGQTVVGLMGGDRRASAMKLAMLDTYANYTSPAEKEGFRVHMTVQSSPNQTVTQP